MRERAACIVVPCYNEAARFDAEAFDAALSSTANLSFVFVNDGSTDETSLALHTLAGRHRGRIEVLDQSRNGGKAEAVRQGMLCAFSRGPELAGYWDADLSTPLDAVRDFAAVLDGSASVDIVLGARVAVLGHQIERRLLRHYTGRFFATLASVTIGLPVYDTQCGAKLFRVNDRTRALFERPFGSRWVFDVELIARYLHHGGAVTGIRELPLRQWTDVAGSKVRAVDFFSSLVELGRIRLRYRTKPRRRGSEAQRD